MKILVISHRHYLLPFAWRLKREGHDVEVACWHASKSTRQKGKWDHAWDGKFKNFLPSNKHDHQESVARVREAAEEGQAFVVTDSREWARRFEGYERLVGVLEPEGERTSVKLGSWFDGEQHEGVHLLVVDHGAQTGGLGPSASGGVTLVRQEGDPLLFQHLLNLHTDRLKSAGFRGLVSVDVAFTQDGRLESVGCEAGWPWLHTHAFAADQPALGDLVVGVAREPVFPRRHVVALPVSMPPWPLDCNLRAPEVKIEGLDTEAVKHMFFHDMTFKDGEVWTAGLDGLVAVVRGSADRLELARRKALLLASKIELPEKQYRADVGGQTEQVLSAFEELGIS